MKQMVLLLVVCLQITTVNATIPTDKKFTNSLGMKFVRVEPGTFEMGQLKTPLPKELLPEYRGRGLFDTLTNGDFDEKPVHSVTITKPFYVGMFEVTNFQYELFDPEHKKLRGWHGFSTEDDEAVVFISWYDAQAHFDTSPTSAKLRFIYTQNNSRWRIFYTFDPDSDPDIKLPQSKTGLYYGKPFTESTAIGILMSNVQADLDNFKIKPLTN
jgi:hypothetical protein